MLVKVTTGVNFINILCPHFAPIFLRQNISKPKPNKRKAVRHNMLMKLTPGQD